MDNQLVKIKTSPKDFFIQLLSIVTLYASAISFITLIFQYINIFLPDILNDPYVFDRARGFGRGALATLLVIFPIYVWLNWYLNKDYIKNPEKLNLKIRKWLLYFTLFVAAIIIIVDLVVLVKSFLEGELTLRFILKVLTVGFVASSVFGYYLTDIKKHKVEIE